MMRASTPAGELTLRPSSFAEELMARSVYPVSTKTLQWMSSSSTAMPRRSGRFVDAAEQLPIRS